MERIHHLTVQTSKRWFLTDDLFVVVHGGLRREDAIGQKFRPVILYSLTVESIPLRTHQISSEDEPLSLTAFLRDCWNGSGMFRGLPDTLKVSREILSACPTLRDYASSHGVRLEVVSGTDKRYAASKRSAQNEYLDSQDPVDASTGSTLPTLVNRYLHRRSEFSLRFKASGSGREGEAERAWLNLPVRLFNPSTAVSSGKADWSTGPWLWKSEGTIPPLEADQYVVDLTVEDQREGKKSKGEPRIHYCERQAKEIGERTFDCLEEINRLLPSWPESLSTLAKSMGATRQELNWYLQGKQPIDDLKALLLREHLNLELVPDMDPPFAQCSGVYLLIARDQRITSAYDDISHGGDLEISVEVLPSVGGKDPDWRFVLAQSYGGFASILAFPRNSPLEKLLVPGGGLINFQGPVAVDRFIYDEVLRCFNDGQIDLRPALRKWEAFQIQHLQAFEAIGEHYGPT